MIVINGIPSRRAGHFPADWDSEDAGVRKYLFTESGGTATFSINPAWPGGVLRAAIEKQGNSGTDSEVLSAVTKVVSFDPMTIEVFLGTALALSLDPSRVQEAMDNDDYVKRLTSILETGRWVDFGFVINFHPSQIALTTADKSLLMSIPNQNRFIDEVAAGCFSSAPETITEADVAAARAMI